jgi:hypothetical protein
MKPAAATFYLPENAVKADVYSKKKQTRFEAGAFDAFKLAVRSLGSSSPTNGRDRRTSVIVQPIRAMMQTTYLLSGIGFSAPPMSAGFVHIR